MGWGSPISEIVHGFAGTEEDRVAETVAVTGSDVRPGRGLVAVACLSTLVVNANTSAVSILLPAIAADLDSSVALLQWAVTGYLLVGAAVIVTSGAMGDVFGRRKVFLAGLLVFIGSCVLIALAGSGWVVVLGRFIQGSAGATLLACGLSLLSVGSSGREQMRAVSTWGAAAAVGAAVGPVVGGVLVEATGWQGLFWIDAVIALACVPLTLRTVTESWDPTRPRTIDLAGTVLVAGLLAPFVFAVTKGASWGWASWPTLTCLAVSAACGVGFVLVEQRVSAPLVDLRMLRNTVLVGSTIAILIGAGAIAALSLLLSLYFQDPAGLGVSSLDAGLAILPVATLLVLVAPAVTPLSHRFGPRPVILVGFVLLTVGFGLLVAVKPGWTYGTFLVPLLAIALGLGLSNGPSSALSTSCVPPEDVGAASGISNMARYVGGAVMTAVAAGIYTNVATARAGQGDAADAALAGGFGAASLALAIFCATGIALALLAGRRSRRRTTLVDYAAAAAGTAHTIPTQPGSPPDGRAGPVPTSTA